MNLKIEQRIAELEKEVNFHRQTAAECQTELQKQVNLTLSKEGAVIELKELLRGKTDESN